MSRIDAWIGNSRAESNAHLIEIKPTSITIDRNGTAVAPQTVRLETLGSQRQYQTQSGAIHMIDALALGYKGHPTIADTDIQAGDRFRADGVNYEVVVVMPAHEFCVQAYLRVRS